MKFSPLRNRWAAHLTFVTFAVLCAVLSTGLLTLQQSMVNSIEETRTVMVPKIQGEIRTMRNLEMMRHYGAVVSQSTDEQVRLKVAFVAAIVASNCEPADERTYKLATEADVLIRGIAGGVRDPEQWHKMENRLSLLSDELTSSTGQQMWNRVEEIGNRSLQMRNLSGALAALFLGSTAIMAVVGRFLKVEIKARKQLFNEASHDFRQRLHGMQLLINAAQRMAAREVPTVMLRLTAVMGDLQRYLDNFLEIARMDAVVVRPEMGRVSLQRVFQRLEIQFEEVAKHNTIDVKFRHTRAMLFIDERILLRMLENVIANAIKFARSKVLVAMRCRNGRAEVWVMDDGRGVPEASLKKLRREFVQGDGAPKPGTSGGGFGLGLSIVTRSAKLLNASVGFSSKLGHGSVVKITLNDGSLNHPEAAVLNPDPRGSV